MRFGTLLLFNSELKLKHKELDDEESVSNSDDDDLRRLKGVTEKDIARMTKYHQMSMRLTLKLQEMNV